MDNENKNPLTPEEESTPAQEAIEPVSYTHLDVYKRQQLLLNKNLRNLNPIFEFLIKSAVEIIPKVLT